MTTGLLELGEIMMTASERRLEVVSRNVSNTTTPGFKKGVIFQEALTEAGATDAARAQVSVFTDFAPGGLRVTGRPFDLAISSAGFFRIRSDDRIYYTRSGQFERGADGRVTNAQGLALQTADGEDLIVSGVRVEILQDGTVLEGGLPVARIGLFELSANTELEAIGGTLFTANDSTMQQVAAPVLRQGMLESANVDMAAEMIEMMSALRQAEVGARVVQAYDSLVGQSITTFGRTQR